MLLFECFDLVDATTDIALRIIKVLLHCLGVSFAFYRRSFHLFDHSFFLGKQVPDIVRLLLHLLALRNDVTYLVFYLFIYVVFEKLDFLFIFGLLLRYLIVEVSELAKFCLGSCESLTRVVKIFVQSLCENLLLLVICLTRL